MLLKGNDGNPLNDHQRKNDQREDDSVTKQPPSHGKIIAIAGNDVDQQTGADGDNQNDCQQTQQPHDELRRLVKPARHTKRRVLGFLERDQFPSLPAGQQFAGQLIVQRVATLVRGIGSEQRMAK